MKMKTLKYTMNAFRGDFLPSDFVALTGIELSEVLRPGSLSLHMHDTHVHLGLPALVLASI